MKNLIKSFKDFKFYDINNLENLEIPDNFYSTLKYYFRISDEATINSMYVGTDGLIGDLIKTIKKRKRKGKFTKISLDKNRGYTKQLDKFIKEQLLEDCFIFVDPSPNVYISRLKEINAVFHSKLYMFDSNIIISGANLDNSYFTNRLDRYFLIKDYNLSKDLKHYKINKDIDNTNIKNNCLFVFNHKQELEVLSRILDANYDSIYISSAYFNLPKSYIDLLQKHKNVNIFVNSPKMNHFDNFGFIGNLVTNVYKYSSYYVLKYLKKASLYEFEMEGYTMHKKGIWAFKGDTCVTIIGSSNFNRRSIERDTELNFCIITTTTKKYVKLFKNEISFLKKNSKKRNIEDFKFVWYNFIYIIIFYIFIYF